MKEKRYILATQDDGAFIGTAAEVTEAWLKTGKIKVELDRHGYSVTDLEGYVDEEFDLGTPVTLEGAYEHYFKERIIPDQCESHSVYVLDADTNDALTAHPWHFDGVAPY